MPSKGAGTELGNRFFFFFFILNWGHWLLERGKGRGGEREKYRYKRETLTWERNVDWTLVQPQPVLTPQPTHVHCAGINPGPFGLGDHAPTDYVTPARSGNRFLFTPFQASTKGSQASHWKYLNVSSFCKMAINNIYSYWSSRMVLMIKWRNVRVLCKHE